QGWREHAVDPDNGPDPLAAAIADVADGERVAMARENLTRLVRAFRRLPEKQQLVVELVRLEGFSMAAAAENLGVTLPSVKMAVFRAGAALREAVLDETEPTRTAPASPDPLAAPMEMEEEQPHGVT